MNSSNFTNFTNRNCPDANNQIFYYLTTFGSCLFNFILLYLIRVKTHDLMIPYLKVLYSSVVLDVISSIIQGLTQKHPVIFGDSIVVTMVADGLLPRALQNLAIFAGGNLNYLMIPEYFACYSVFTFCVIPFLYRYLMICWDYQMSNFVFGIATLFNHVTAFIRAFCICHLSALVHQESLLLIPDGNPDCSQMMPLISANMKTINPQLLFIYKIWAWSQIALYFIFVINLYFSIHIFIHLRKRSLMISEENRRVQRQITLTFVVQGFLPLIIYYWPFAAMSALLIYPEQTRGFMFSRQTMMTLLFRAYALISLTNPLVVILMISSYRETLFGPFLRYWKKVFDKQTSTAHPTNNAWTS